MTTPRTPEHLRLEKAQDESEPWKLWGPYLSERQWGTVREDYSKDGNAWDYFTHDQARSRAYRWGEDGLGGISDEHQQLCFALALWNGKDPIIKERLFGLANSEGNHGEDVKEYYFYLDSTPTHSYMKYLYKYPQKKFPYEDLVKTNAKRSRTEFEYELLDTGVFDHDRYFDVFIEYAKAGTDDMLVTIRVCNRGPDQAILHLLPTLWFRNTWSTGAGEKPSIVNEPGNNLPCLAASHARIGRYRLYGEAGGKALFCDNETNDERIFGKPLQGYPKDGINNYIVNGAAGAINPGHSGTKAALHYLLTVPGGAEQSIKLRLQSHPEKAPVNESAFKDFDTVAAKRKAESDEYYAEVIPAGLSADQKSVMRQAFAGMLWSKQYYYFDLDTWLDEHGVEGPYGDPKGVRNAGWVHLHNNDIISMPDKWEYPWYAAWDLAFHCLPLALIDSEFAKQQLLLVLRDSYLHPSGQIPAYEWNFGDVNPPVHAWACMYVYNMEREKTGQADRAFLQSCFQKLLLNFTWWVNRKDPTGRNVFQGGFLGLDNIGVFDRSSPLPTGGYLEQSDGTAWMALFCQCMLEMAVELAEEDETYIEMAVKFIQHFL